MQFPTGGSIWLSVTDSCLGWSGDGPINVWSCIWFRRRSEKPGVGFLLRP
jgi:hypothetical protein